MTGPWRAEHTTFAYLRGLGQFHSWIHSITAVMPLPLRLR